MERDTGRLLIVDDDELNRETLAECIRPGGFALETVADGDAALRRVDEEDFDVVLLDIGMPGIDGFEVLRRIRESRPPTRLPVIMITGMGERGHVVQALKLGANDYIVKPFDPAIVTARIRTQLALKRSVDQIMDLEHDLENKNIELERANCELGRTYRQMKGDLESAAAVQRALLPAALPETPGVTFAWMYKPCDDLAGDSLNVFQLDEEHVAFYLLDVSGHGVCAALLSVAISRLLAPVAGQPSIVQRRGEDATGLEPTPPCAVAEELNRRFQLDAQTYQYFTLFYGVLNVRTHELRYICAGQAGPIYVPRDGEPREVNNHAIAIGLVPEPQYCEARMQLKPGDRLYLYSDGLDEARNASKELFGSQRVVRTVTQVRDESLDESLSKLVLAAETWAGHPFEDDVSAIALETGTP